MDCSRMPLFVIFLICIVPRRSDGYFFKTFRYLVESDHNSNQMSPSPSPSPTVNLDSAKAPSPVSRTNDENCDDVFNKCEIRDFGITACVPFVGNGSEAVYLLILNSGANLVKLNYVLGPTDGVPRDIEISGHQIKKVNLPPNMEGDSFILLYIEKGNCVIHLGASVPQGFYYTQYVTPTYGAYLLFVAAVCIGGTFACCKLVKRRRHLDGGIPYKELEMGHQDSDPSFVIETPEGWDENWDDDWDDEKAVRSPDAKKSSQNGAPLKYVDTSQWGNDWDDEA